MRVNVERLLELIITVASVLIVGNAIADSWLGAGSLVPAEYYTTATVLGVAWLLALIFVPKRIT